MNNLEEKPQENQLQEIEILHEGCGASGDEKLFDDFEWFPDR
jgi:hypothetical protein